MKIVLANLPWRHFGRKGVRAGSRWPHIKAPSERDYMPFPFFLAQATALLRKYDFDADLLDAIADGVSYKYFFKMMHKVKPGLLVCETSTVTLDHDLRLLNRIEKTIPIVLCGPDVNIRKPSFLKNHGFIDYVIVGEYEFTLLDLVRHIKEGKALDGVLGIIYRDSKTVKVNPPRPLIDLDELPWPVRKTSHMNIYNDTPGDMPISSAQMLASRGCPYRCKFCLWPQVMYQSNQYRTRDVIDVVDEMEYLVKEMNFKSIYFDDDTFNIGKKRILEFCDEIKKRKLSVPWAIMARADLMDEELLVNMREAGLYAVKYGVESATQALLDNIDKDMDIKKTEEVINSTKRLGIKTHLTFTFGLPGETKETIRRTIGLALKLDPVTVQFSITTPFPGTSFYKEMKEKGNIVSEKWSEYDGNYKSVVTSEHISGKDFEWAIRFAYKEWTAHCVRRDSFKDNGYYQLLLESIKKYGFFTSLLRAGRFLTYRLKSFFKERSLYIENVKKRPKEYALKIGRLGILFDEDRLSFYWDDMRLTRGQGLVSFLGFQDDILQGHSDRKWNFKRIDKTELILTRKWQDLDLEEMWRIKIVDEKQIDWDVEVCLKNTVNSLAGKIMVIFSGRYKTWVDSWGEGRFYPVNDYRDAELRNPNTEFIALRGRKKLKGQLPTFFMDIKGENRRYLPSIKNADSFLGARTLEVKTKFCNGNTGNPSNVYRMFSVRMKIVEEDFLKRKLSRTIKIR
ncbi:B12-binding domain-containing radical SAM protein [Candidatus Omnitrophota bacterium]